MTAQINPPAFADQRALTSTLNRVSGLTDAIVAILDTNCDENTKANALRAIGDTLALEAEKLLNAAEREQVVVINSNIEA